MAEREEGERVREGGGRERERVGGRGREGGTSAHSFWEREGHPHQVGSMELQRFPREQQTRGILALRR